MPTLPTLIFADENHLSPINYNILTKLAPRLKLLGYNNFYAELPARETRDQVIDACDKAMVELEQLKTAFFRVEIEVIDYLEEMEKLVKTFPTETAYNIFTSHFMEQLAKREGTNDYLFLLLILAGLEIRSKLISDNNFVSIVKELLLSMSAVYSEMKPLSQQAIKNLVETLSMHQIHFQGIDDSAALMNLSMDSLANLNKTLTTLNQAMDIKKRDKIMVNAYLQPNKSVFGMVGLAHVTGMQALLSTMITNEIAKANFNFIYVYSIPLDSQLYNAAPEAQQLLANMRDGTTPLPLGITMINGLNRSENEIVEEIMIKIQEKIAEYKLLPDDVKKIPDLSYTGQLHTKLSNLYGLFGTVKSEISSGIEDTVISQRNLG